MHIEKVGEGGVAAAGLNYREAVPRGAASLAGGSGRGTWRPRPKSPSWNQGAPMSAT